MFGGGRIRTGLVRLGGPREAPACRDETERRVLRALATMRVPGVVASHYSGARSTWPAYIHTLEDLKAQSELIELEPGPVEAFRPDQRDLTDWLEASTWWTLLDDPKDRHPRREVWSLNRYQKIVALRSLVPPMSFGGIGILMDKSERTAAAWYDRALDVMHRTARERLA